MGGGTSGDDNAGGSPRDARRGGAAPGWARRVPDGRRLGLHFVAGTRRDDGLAREAPQAAMMQQQQMMMMQQMQMQQAAMVQMQAHQQHQAAAAQQQAAAARQKAAEDAAAKEEAAELDDDVATVGEDERGHEGLTEDADMERLAAAWREAEAEFAAEFDGDEYDYDASDMGAAYGDEAYGQQRSSSVPAGVRV
ncbi:hypothetical protein THAOC_13203, partial [Thalassiosira oceanica]